MVECQFFQDRINKIKEQIIAAEDAVDGLLTGGIVSYSLDTGQSSTQVTKMNIKTLNNYIESLMEKLMRYEARKNGGGTIIAGPVWGN